MVVPSIPVEPKSSVPNRFEVKRFHLGDLLTKDVAIASQPNPAATAGVDRSPPGTKITLAESVDDATMTISGPHFEILPHGIPPSPAGTRDAPEEEIGRLLLRSAERLLAALEPRMAEVALNQARLQVLEVLWRFDETGCSQTQLACELLLSESNLSTLVDRMGEDGLVSRQRSESDRRKTVIRLTSDGALALDRAISTRRDSLRQLLGGLDDADKQALRSLLQQFLERLEQQLMRQGRRRVGVGRGAAGAAVSVRTMPQSRHVSND